ncbi:MAG: hypothetical protein ACRCY4_09505 [Brevinema sp.]
MVNRLEASAYNTFVHNEPFRHTPRAAGRSGLIVGVGLGLLALGGRMKNSVDSRTKVIGWALAAIGLYMSGHAADDLYANNAPYNNLPAHEDEFNPIVDPRHVFGTLENVERVIQRARRT